MKLYLNMNSRLTIGDVLLENITSGEITENINEISTLGTITIPREYKKLEGKPLLENIAVGDSVILELGYNGEYYEEFSGYLTEIEAEKPLVLHVQDESWKLKQTNIKKSYASCALKQVLTDITSSLGIKIICPDMNLGKLIIDNVSAWAVLDKIKQDYGLYSRLSGKTLTVQLRDLLKGDSLTNHTYILSPISPDDGYFTKKNDLKFKRKEDYKLRVKVSSVHKDGKIESAEAGSKEENASKLTINYPGVFTKAELQKLANQLHLARCYDGFHGSITGFGYPRTHAGDTLTIEDRENAERTGRFLIEKVNITWDESGGYSRKNELGYLL